MKINHNDSAVIANVKLLRNETFLTDSMERLSSGFRLNHAKDDPSGVAISNKMQAQINALSQASRNSSDGLSVLETADGTMQELTNILQRVRELSVQAANDANCNEDRDSIQVEINELLSEVDRISESSEFNTKSLLDGSLDTHSYGDHMTRRHISSSVQEGFYYLKVDKAATQAEMPVTLNFAEPVTKDQVCQLKINDSVIDIKAGMTKDEVNEAIRAGCERGDAEAVFENGNLKSFKSKDYGEAGKLLVSTSPVGAAMFGVAETEEENLKNYDTNPGEDAEITWGTSPDPDKRPNAFDDHVNATIKQKDNKITVSDTNGFEISFKLEAEYEGDLELEVTDVGPMDIQVGANAYQQIPVRIPSVSIEDMYLDKINVGTFITASKAIESCDEAIAYVNTARARIGAYSNRLEHTVLSTDNYEENMTAAISRVKDVDMAEEMTEYTKQNVLVQAATSALSQANELPQMALQLLQ